MKSPMILCQYVLILIMIIIMDHGKKILYSSKNNPDGRKTELSCFSLIFQTGAFMGFSITSAVFGGIIIIIYSLSVYYSDYDRGVAIIVIILLLGIAEFGMGISAAVFCCLMSPCCACCGETVPQHQVRTNIWFY